MHRDIVTRSWGIVMPFIRHHHLMLQHDNALSHVARICTQSAYSPDCHPLSMFGMLWYDNMFQFLPISSNSALPLKRSGSKFHRPQSTTWSTLYKGDEGKWWSHQILKFLIHYKISYTCSIGLRSGDGEGHSIWFTSFLYSSNHSMTSCALWMQACPPEETLPIRIEMFHLCIKVITHNSFVLICIDLSS